MIQPIWKDYLFTANGDYIDYTVSLNGTVIYRGRAYKRPGASQIEWSINDVAANYLQNDFPTLPSIGTASYTTERAKGLQQFTVAYGDISRPIKFLNDWSYVAVTDNVWRQLLQIFDVVDIRLPFLITKPYEDLSVGQLNEMSTYDGPGGSYTGTLSWKVGQNTCWRYALYFLNAFGGWSFIYLEAVKALEDYDRKTAKRLYNSSDLKARGAVNYVNEVTRRWNAKTPYLTDDQASKMWHVLGTTSAYLFDMETQQVTPVNVTNGSMEEKTYRNQGAKRVRYDINLTLAQDRLRRL